MAIDCWYCLDKGWYWSELPDSGNADGIHVRCRHCLTADKKIKEIYDRGDDRFSDLDKREQDQE